MIQHLFAYKNCESGFYSLPFNVRCERDEIINYFKEGLSFAPDRTLESMAHDDLFYVGLFDTQTGVIIPENEFIMHLSPIVSELLDRRSKDKLKEGEDNGESKNGKAN